MMVACSTMRLFDHQSIISPCFACIMILLLYYCVDVIPANWRYCQRQKPTAIIGKLTIAPKPSRRLGYAEAKWISPVGTIESNWRYSGDQVILEVTIPSNVIAEIRLPDGNTIHAETGIHVFSCKA